MDESITSIIVVCATLAISQLSPGPDVFYVFRTSLTQGFRRGMAVAFGINMGFLIQSIVACTLGAWVLEQSWSSWLIVGAACWLLYLAWRICPRGTTSSELQLQTDGHDREPVLSLIRNGFLCNILNPKCMLFILSLTTDSLRNHAGLNWYVPVLIASLFVASLLGWGLWSGFLQWAPLRRAYLSHTRTVDLVFALILAAFAVLLLASLWQNEPIA